MDATYWEENSNTQILKYESCNSNDETGPTSALTSLVPGILGPGLASLQSPVGGSGVGSASGASLTSLSGGGGATTSSGVATPRLKDEPLFRCCDSNLNFATVHCSEDDSEYGQYKKNKVSRQDPMSHRIIEKRRRDRMNNCLADLSRLIPADYLKKGRGRIEKTEIIEMAIKHIKYLQQIHRNVGRDENDRGFNNEQYRLGYQECMSETMRFLVEVEGYFAREAFCVRLINHLQKHCDDLLQDRITAVNKINGVREKEFCVGSTPTTMPNLNNINGNSLNGSINQEIPSPNIRMLSSPSHNTTSDYDMSRNHKDESREIKSEVMINENHAVPSDLRLYQSNEGSEGKKEDKIVENGRECHSLYKFKNNIKQRFTQDLTAENQLKVFKRRKLSEPIRRTSITLETYSENHSSPNGSSQCSPPSSEFRISSESESRISPTGSSVSDNRTHRPSTYNLKPEKPSYGRYSPLNPKYPIKNIPLPITDVEKSNFGVPIFALHAKGSFYIPLTIDYNTLMPFLHNNNLLDVLPNVHNIILHPVTINVNFQTNYFNNVMGGSVRSKKIETHNGWT